MQKAPRAQGRGGLLYLGAHRKPNLKKRVGVHQVSLGGGDAWKYLSGRAFQIKEVVQQKFRRDNWLHRKPQTWLYVSVGVERAMKTRLGLSLKILVLINAFLEKEMATHSSILAWRIPGTEEPSELPSMGLHRVGHD